MAERHRVLVVDDEPDVLLLCRVNLEFEGYEVIEAADGVEALEQARRHRPDVVLLDASMPLMDGWQVLAELKADDDLKDTPVVMLTAMVPDPDVMPSGEGGAAEYITKPFSPLGLSQVLRDVIGNG